MQKLKILIGALVVFYLAGAGYLYIYQRDFLYFPTVKTEHIYEIVQFTSSGETLDVVVLNKGKQNAIIYHGGNGEQVVNNAASFIDIFKEHTIYLVNYRGFSGSTGTPAEKSIYSDAQYIYDTVAKNHVEISVIGRSLGSGVATFLASTRKVSRMVLITPYDSILNIAQDQYPMYPISLLLEDEYNSSSRIKDITAPTLIILAENDLVIPLKYSSQLIKEFSPTQATVELIKDAGHTSILEKMKYYRVLREFFK